MRLIQCPAVLELMITFLRQTTAYWTGFERVLLDRTAFADRAADQDVQRNWDFLNPHHI